jgi:hypothetical protein
MRHTGAVRGDSEVAVAEIIERSGGDALEVLMTKNGPINFLFIIFSLIALDARI